MTEPKIEFHDEVMLVDHFWNDKWSDKAIEHYDAMEQSGFTHSASDLMGANIQRQDGQLFVNAVNESMMSAAKPMIAYREAFDRMWDVYKQKFTVLENYPELRNFHVKIQKTSMAGGYHHFHFEQAPHDCRGRVAVWMLYLNDVEMGGETEFLYKSLRVTPKKSRLLIWPAGFTHTHRGNPPLSGDKYIMTGWVEHIV